MTRGSPIQIIAIIFSFFGVRIMNIHSMTIGYESIVQMNDVIERVTRIQKEIQ